MRKHSILFLNAGYFADVHGSLREYILRGHRQIITTATIQQRTGRKLIALLAKLQPDVCCLAEVTPKTFRYIQEELSSLYPHWVAANKYGPGRILSRIPLLRKRFGGILMKKKLPCRRHLFSHGMKKTLYEVRLEKDLSLFVAHFPLSAAARKKQFHELNILLPRDRRIILCGDFNIFRGQGELNNLIQDRHLHIVNQKTDHTYPAHCPKKSLDLFLCSPNISDCSLRVITAPLISDHLPVLFAYRASH